MGKYFHLTTSLVCREVKHRTISLLRFRGKWIPNLWYRRIRGCPVASEKNSVHAWMSLNGLPLAPHGTKVFFLGQPIPPALTPVWEYRIGSRRSGSHLQFFHDNKLSYLPHLILSSRCHTCSLSLRRRFLSSAEK